MTKRIPRTLLFGTLGAMLALAGAWFLWPRTAITRENAAKIKVGMTRTEVETILGGPPCDETTGPVNMDGGGWPAVAVYARIHHSQDPDYLAWKSDTFLIGVALDDTGRVRKTETVKVERADESRLDMIRRWLRL